MINIEINQEISASTVQVSAVLLDHQQLDRFFNAEFKLIKAQNQG